MYHVFYIDIDIDMNIYQEPSILKPPLNSFSCDIYDFFRVG
jgi:hypothetical protein